MVNESTSPKAASPLRIPATVGVLGVVFGDIGTSPLYAMRECFAPGHGLKVTENNVYGVASLIFWALTITVSLKYVSYVMRADNRGEGGILALMALSLRKRTASSFRMSALTILGMAGAALLYGDGIITPAISVMSAVEGVSLLGNQTHDSSIVISCIILVLLFSFQHRGTGGLGAVFGPLMSLWFTALALLGVRGISEHPEIIGALNPGFAVRLLMEHQEHSLVIIGAVFLVATGGEALYADMGHFGRSAIGRSWFFIVGPSLLLNYLGQGALLLSHPEAVSHPFFALAPPKWVGALVLLSTCAAVIASQALISGAFSLTQQAIMLGFFPRMKIEHTSAHARGQVYAPAVNRLLCIGTLLAVLAFGSSSSLAAAYGVAVASTMVLTTLLAAFAFRVRFEWSRWRVLTVSAVFLIADLAFFVACARRFGQGGFAPILLGAALFFVMLTWSSGRSRMRTRMESLIIPVSDFFEIMRIEQPARAPGVAVFMSATASGTPLALMRNLQHNRVVHREVILLTVRTRSRPFVDDKQQLRVTDLGNGFKRVVYRVGFMQQPRPALVLPAVAQHTVEHTTFYFNNENLVVSPEHNLWTRTLLSFFIMLSRNETRAANFFGLPSDRVIEMGGRLEL